MNQAKADKMLKKMLKSQAGREVIGKNLPVEFSNDVKDDGRPIVAVLVPCYDTPTAEMANALALMMDECKKNNIMCYTGPVIRDSSVVHWTRNYLMAELIKTQRPWTHVLFIDDDIVPPADAIVRMLDHKKDIIAGACTRRQDPPIPNFRWWDEKMLAFREIFDWAKGTLLEVGAVGTGLMMISRKAMEEVANAYFNCLYEIEAYQISEEVQQKLQKARLEFFDKHANAFWFRFLPGLAGCNEYGEDISFCLMAWRYCKIPVYVDTSIQPGHIGRYAFSIRDYDHYSGEIIEKAKKDGTYLNAVPKHQEYAIEVTD